MKTVRHQKKAIGIGIALLLAAVLLAGISGASGSSAASLPQTDFDICNFVTADAGAVQFAGGAAFTGGGYSTVDAALSNATASLATPLYKHLSMPDGTAKGNLVLLMSGTASVDELTLTFFYDADNRYKKPLAELTSAKAGAGAGYPALQADAVNAYIINFENSFEETERFPNGVSLASGKINGFYLHNETGASGTLSLCKVYYTPNNNDANAEQRKILNDFVGGGTVLDAARACDPYVFAADTAGTRNHRAAMLPQGGSVLVKNETRTSQGYQDLLVTGRAVPALTAEFLYADGGRSAPFSFTGACALPKAEIVGVKLTNLSAAAAVIERISYTDYYTEQPQTAYPFLNTAAAQLFDHFDVPQETFAAAAADGMAETPVMRASGLSYRIAPRGAGAVSVKDGALSLNASNLQADDYIQVSIASKTAARASDTHLVLKMKLAGGADIQGFRLSLSETGGYRTWAELRSANGLALPALTETGYPYRTADGWYYVLVDLEASGFSKTLTENNTLVQLYYQGGGTVYVDEIFRAQQDATAPADYPAALQKMPAFVAYDITPPVISFGTLARTGSAGDTVSLAAVTVTDDRNAAADLVLQYSVKKEGVTVPLSEALDFTAEEGTYTLTVTARDTAGNSATAHFTLEIEAADNGKDGLSGGAVAGIVIGGVVFAAGICAGLLLLSKKQKSKKTLENQFLNGEADDHDTI